MSSVRKYVLKPFESEEQREQEHQHVDHNYAKPANNAAHTNAKPYEDMEHSSAKPNAIDSIYSQDITKPAKNKIKERARLKMENILKIITSIALVNGYDRQRRIRGSNGQFVTNTDIIELIVHAMQPGKVLKGEEEFVNLLHEAKVDPDWLFNDNVKSKLITSRGYETPNGQAKVIKQVEAEPTMYVEKTSPLQVKRKSPEDTVNNIENKKRKLNWDYSDDE